MLAEKTCASKYCTRELFPEKSSEAKFQLWAPYCSRYCRLMMRKGIKPQQIKDTCSKCGETGHNRRTCGRTSKTNKRGDYTYRVCQRIRMPPIAVVCDSCGEDFNVTYEDQRKGSQFFCSRTCYRDTTTRKLAGKNSYRDYHILKNLREFGGGNTIMHSSEIARLIQNAQGVQASSTSIGLILKRWRAQGIVDMVDEQMYEYIGKGPLGPLIRAANHAQLSKD